MDAVELAQTYTQRWSAQENIIRDFLLPLGARYQSWLWQNACGEFGGRKAPDCPGKTAGQCERWADAARKRSHNASKLYTKRCKLTKDRATALYRVLNDHQIELEQQGMQRLAAA